MKLGTLLAIYAAVALMFSAGLLAAPAFWITLYGASPDAQATLLLRLVGALFSGLAAMAWAARRAERSAARDAMVLGLTVLNGAAAAVAVAGAHAGIYNRLAWGPVTTFALLTAAFLTVGRANRSGVVSR